MAIDLNEGILEHRRGQLERAADVYRAALAENPDNPDALHLLGVVRLQQGDARQAVELMGRSAALRPIDPANQADLGKAYRAIGQPERAVACYLAALRLRPNNPEVHYDLALTLMQQGKVTAAIAHLREAIRQKPEFAAAHNVLGSALVTTGDKAAALQCFRRAVRLDPASAEARCNLGTMLTEQAAAAEGLVHCREAVRLRPNLSAAHNNLGNTLLALGRLEEAKASLLEALRLEPNLTHAYATLAHVWDHLGEFDQALRSIREALRRDPQHAKALALLATRLQDKLPAADQATIERLLANPGLSPESRFHLQFGLAQALDARGEFDRAAELSREANALQLADLRKRGLAHGPDLRHEFVERSIAVFTPEFFARVRGFGLETERPVFVVGLPRSGTSLTEQILASHPRVFGAGEVKLVQETVELLPATMGREGKALDVLEYLDSDAVRQLADRHLGKLAALNNTADRIVDKLPGNALYLGFIATLFPRAKLIHCRRDVRDVALSCWLTCFRDMHWACDADQIASQIAEYQRLMEHWRRALPVPMYELDYEALVADLEGKARELISSCGLEWDPACLEFYNTKRAVRTASVAQVRQPIYSSSVGRWRNYERSLASLFAKLGS